MDKYFKLALEIFASKAHDQNFVLGYPCSNENIVLTDAKLDYVSFKMKYRLSITLDLDAKGQLFYAHRKVVLLKSKEIPIEYLEDPMRKFSEISQKFNPIPMTLNSLKFLAK